MRVLIGSPAFPPSLGGLERVVEQLAGGLSARGHLVTVVTRTASVRPDRYPFRVVRSPGPFARLRLVRDSDVFLQANVALKDLWPLLLVRRPWVVSHHGLYGGSTLRSRLAARLKVALARRATARIAVSRFLAAHLDEHAEVIPNPYRDDLFRRTPDARRDRDLVFAGRLVSDKGCATLVSALAKLDDLPLRPTLTIVGEGPEREALAGLVRRLGLEDRVELTGRLDGEELARMLGRHRVLVVPSLVEEGFGIVALEGIACGCRVVGSAVGGLPEAIGPCGRTFPPGDDDALAAVLREVLEQPDVDLPRDVVDRHLQPSRQERVVQRYDEVLARAAGERP